MGGIITRNQQDVKLYLQKDYYLHDYPYIRSKSNNKILIVRQIITDSKQQAQKIRKNAITYKKISNQSINKIIDYIPLQINKICSQQEYHYIIQGGHPKTSLKDQFFQRKKINERFSQNQIISIVKTFCSGLDVFNKHFNRKFQIISLNLISIDEDNNFQLRLNDPLLNSQNVNFNKILSQKVSFKNQGQSAFNQPPERKKARKSMQFNKNQIQVNSFFCNLYAIGIITLQISKMDNLKNQNNKSKSLQNQINSVQNSNLKKIIQILTSQNPQKRIQIFTFLGIKFSQKNQLQKLYLKTNKHNTKISRPQTPTFNFQDLNASTQPIKYHIHYQKKQTNVNASLLNNKINEIQIQNQNRNQTQRNKFYKTQNVPLVQPFRNFQMYRNSTQNSSSDRTQKDLALNINKPKFQVSNQYYSQLNKPFIKFNENIKKDNFYLPFSRQNKQILINKNQFSNQANINFQNNSVIIPKNFESFSSTIINNSLNKNNLSTIGSEKQTKKSIFYQQFGKRSYNLNDVSPIQNTQDKNHLQKKIFQIDQNERCLIKNQQQVPAFRPNKQVQQILKRLGIGELLYQNQNNREQNYIKEQSSQSINNKNQQYIQNKKSKQNLTQIMIQKKGQDQIFIHEGNYNLNNKKTINIDFKNNQTYMNFNKNSKQDLHQDIQQFQNRVTTPLRPTIKKFKYNSTIVQVGDQDSQNSSQKSEVDNNKELQNINRQFVIQQYQTGSKYQGNKLNGKRDGFGKFHYQDGGYYQGEWRNNKMDGQGRLYYQGGKMAYQGSWKEDQFHGYGKVYNDNPINLQGGFDFTNFDFLQDYWKYYQGKLVKDTKQGRGKIILTNGQIFQGDFHNDRIQGYGKFFILQGPIIQGIWKDSKLIKIISS